LCKNGHDVVGVDRVPGDGRILLPITARMRTGPCVLYVFGKKEEGTKMVMDMRLVYVQIDVCPTEVGIKYIYLK
jgi:hypothetical protein